MKELEFDYPHDREVLADSIRRSGVSTTVLWLRNLGYDELADKAAPLAAEMEAAGETIPKPTSP